MQLGRIVGKVWATVKDPKLTGIKLYLMQPVDESDQPLGRPVVAADAVRCGEGDLVFWVGSAEATVAFGETTVPCDVAIVGLVDRVDV
jgi:ethanolamine utilization protein EutN